MFDAGIQYHVFKDYDISFDEKGATYGTVRKVQWVKEGEEPDETKGKIEIRKIYNTNDGERTGKGYTFSTEDGPNDLVDEMVDKGFGNTKNILKSVRNRDDFMEAATTINEDTDGSDGEAFDLRDLLDDSNDIEEDEEE